jgi:NAD(P)-dependent dehydrogenase (short-subunit alcohol dehydrogenase family)
MSRPQLLTRPSSVTARSKTVILVSGGNTGIGFEIVKKLASENPNNQILMGCRDTHKGEDAVASMGAPRNVNPIQLDITDDESIEHCFLAIQQHFGKLDVLINNAGTAAKDLSNSGASLRQRYELCVNVNVTSTAVLTDKMVPLLEKSTLPKIIFIGSTVGSIKTLLDSKDFYRGPWYNSSKAAENYLAAYYSKIYPKWKINIVCPGHRSTGLNDLEMSEESDPKLGAIRAVELVAEGPEGVTGTYSRTGGQIPW